ncbi:MAG: serine hydrolase domain-containing protein [Limisphaerales bacterium]
MKTLLAILLVLVTTTGFSASLNQTQIAKIDATIRAEIKKQEVVGVAIGVIRGGKIVHQEGFGYADWEAKIPVTTNTMFRWASISKSVTAVAAMQLWESGQLDLEDDVRRYVPEFPKRAAPVTIDQLLRHQGGIVHYTNGKIVRSKRLYHVPNPYGHVTLALDTLRESPLVNAPGQKYSYSTRGYMLLSAAVERAGRERFADQIEQRISRPLGMSSMQPDYQWRDIPHRTKGYLRRNGEIVESTDTDVSWKLGGGGYISNIGDLARFGIGLMDDRLVHSETRKVMWTVKQPAEGKEVDYALGFKVEGEDRSLKVSHGGSQEKTKTRLVIWPRLGIGVAVMCNTHHAKPELFSTAVNKALQ